MCFGVHLVFYKVSKKIVINKDAMFDEQSMLPKIVDTTMPISDGASPNSMGI